MGINRTESIITSADYHGRRSVLQAGNREWVTVIETIRSTGDVTGQARYIDV